LAAIAELVIGARSSFASAAATLSPLRLLRGRKEYGYNCCEFCGERLGRHPVHTWRYNSECSTCGRDQTWASPTVDA